MTSSSEKPYVTPKVRAAAARNGVDLNTVRGTGVGGRIRLQDVQPGASAVAVARPVALTAVSNVQERLSEWNSAPVKVDVYARNPLLDDLRQASPSVYAAATREAPAPTLFASGDLPPLLASGEDPSMLLRLPWFARHAGAAADRGRLARMLEDAAEDPSGAVLQMSGVANADGVEEYRGRMRRWAMGGQSAPVYAP